MNKKNLTLILAMTLLSVSACSSGNESSNQSSIDLGDQIGTFRSALEAANGNCFFECEDYCRASYLEGALLIEYIGSYAGFDGYGYLKNGDGVYRYAYYGDSAAIEHPVTGNPNLGLYDFVPNVIDVFDDVWDSEGDGTYTTADPIAINAVCQIDGWGGEQDSVTGIVLSFNPSVTEATITLELANGRYVETNKIYGIGEASNSVVESMVAAEDLWSGLTNYDESVQAAMIEVSGEVLPDLEFTKYSYFVDSSDKGKYEIGDIYCGDNCEYLAEILTGAGWTLVRSEYNDEDSLVYLTKVRDLGEGYSTLYEIEITYNSAEYLADAFWDDDYLEIYPNGLLHLTADKIDRVPWSSVIDSFADIHEEYDWIDLGAPEFYSEPFNVTVIDRTDYFQNLGFEYAVLALDIYGKCASQRMVLDAFEAWGAQLIENGFTHNPERNTYFIELEGEYKSCQVELRNDPDGAFYIGISINDWTVWLPPQGE